MKDTLKVGRRRRKRTATEALEEYIRRRKQAKIIKLFGTVEFDHLPVALHRASR